MFRAIAQADLASLERLANVFLEQDRKAAALLALDLDHFFHQLPELRSYKLQEMSLFLDKFLKYARLLHGIISHADPLSSKSIKRLFCITELPNTEYGVGLGSFLHSSAIADRQGPMHLQLFVVALSKGEMVIALRKYLAAHLCERVAEENRLCHNAVVFTPCLAFIVNDQCKRVDCPQEHVKSTDLNAKRYNLRISVHFHQISILQLMYSVDAHLPRQRKYVVIYLCVGGLLKEHLASFTGSLTFTRPLTPSLMLRDLLLTSTCL